MFLFIHRFKYSITKQWDSKPSTGITTVELRRSEEALTIQVTAPFYDDPSPPKGPPGEPFPHLWDYEGTGRYMFALPLLMVFYVLVHVYDNIIPMKYLIVIDYHTFIQQVN